MSVRLLVISLSRQRSKNNFYENLTLFNFIQSRYARLEFEIIFCLQRYLYIYSNFNKLLNYNRLDHFKMLQHYDMQITSFHKDTWQ